MLIIEIVRHLVICCDDIILLLLLKLCCQWHEQYVRKEPCYTFFFQETHKRTRRSVRRMNVRRVHRSLSKTVRQKSFHNSQQCSVYVAERRYCITVVRRVTTLRVRSGGSDRKQFKFYKNIYSPMIQDKSVGLRSYLKNLRTARSLDADKWQYSNCRVYLSTRSCLDRALSTVFLIMVCYQRTWWCH